MKPSTACFDLIKHFEGVKLNAYQDSVGVWTIGVGHTGADVTPGKAISASEALKLLESDADAAASGVSAILPGVVTQCQFDALVSFAFNLGVSALAQSTLLKKLNAGDVQGAADEFPRWVHAGGQTLEGLVKRRAAERALFLGLDWQT